MAALHHVGAAAPGPVTPKSDNARRQPGVIGVQRTADGHYGSPLAPAALRFIGPGSNVRDLRAAELRDLHALSRHVIDTFGTDPCTKGQAAAHEAGHLIVAWALGESLRGARIGPRKVLGRTLWLGINHREGAPGDGTCYSALSNPHAVLHAAAVNLAGYAGEVVVGLDHPSSSLDERFKAQSMCEDLDRVLKLPIGSTADTVTALVFGIFARNRPQFDRLRGHLASRRVASRKDIARLLASVPPTGGTQ